jgi:hypothetical protein
MSGKLQSWIVELHAKNYEKKHHNKTSKVAMDFGKGLWILERQCTMTMGYW